MTNAPHMLLASGRLALHETAQPPKGEFSIIEPPVIFVLDPHSLFASKILC